MSPKSLAGASLDSIQEAIDIADNKNKMAGRLQELASHVITNNGVVPSTKRGLKAMGIDDYVSTILLQEAFCEFTGPAISLSARKILVAIDMVDWEEFAPDKSDINMKHVTDELVQRSLMTWLPCEDQADFHTVIASISNLCSGTVTKKLQNDVNSVVKERLSAKDRSQWEFMYQQMIDFFKTNAD